MAFLDVLSNNPLANTPIMQDIKAASSAVQSVDQFISSSPQTDLITIGTAAAGNLTPAEIAAGLTGAPAQPSVVPSKAPPESISNANPGIQTGLTAKAGMSVGMLGLAAVAAYFVFRR